MKKLRSAMTVFVLCALASLVVLAVRAQRSAPRESAQQTPEEAQQRKRTLAFWDAYHRATDLRIRNDFLGAVAAYREALRFKPEHEDSLYYLGNCLWELGEHRAALDAYEKMVQINPVSSGRAHLQIGALRASPEAKGLFDLDAAERALRQALEVNQEETGPLMRLGEVTLAKGETHAAWEHLTAAIHSNFKAVPAYYLCGYIKWRQGDQKAAQEFFQKAVKFSQPEKPLKGVLSEGDVRPESAKVKPHISALEAMSRHSLFGAHWRDLHNRYTSAVTAQHVVDEYRRFDRFLQEVRQRARQAA